MKAIRSHLSSPSVSLSRRSLLGAVVGCLALAGVARAEAENDRAAERKAMVDVVTEMGRQKGHPEMVLDPAVLQAMGRVRRHKFVPEGDAARAYDNVPLPIGYGQTISQPFMVALMTGLLRVAPGATVLEVGTGSGYQAAMLAELGARVFTIEIVEELGRQVAERLAHLGYSKITPRVGDGYYGWAESGPFDNIIVTAAANHVPPPLVQQLKPGGRMVIPVGQQFQVQHLTLVDKAADGSVTVRELLPVSFVPLTGEH